MRESQCLKNCWWMMEGKSEDEKEHDVSTGPSTGTFIKMKSQRNGPKGERALTAASVPSLYVTTVLFHFVELMLALLILYEVTYLLERGYATDPNVQMLVCGNQNCCCSEGSFYVFSL